MAMKYVTKEEEITLRKAKSIFKKQGFDVILKPIKEKAIKKKSTDMKQKEGGKNGSY